MRLHLDSSSSALAGAGQTAGVQPLGSSSAPRGSVGAAAGDSISLSGVSAALGRLAGDRAQRIGQLAAAVASGAYQPQSAAISRAIVAQAGS